MDFQIKKVNNNRRTADDKTKMSVITDFQMPKTETIDALRNELKTWVNMMSGDNIALRSAIVRKTLFCINQHTLDEREVGKEKATALRAWWNESKTREELGEILQTKMAVDGTPRNWSSGFMGSRWCDVIINRRLTRVAFTSRKFNRMPSNMPHKDFMIELDASDSRVMTDAQIKADKKNKVCVSCGEFGKTMKTECCGERYCDNACWKEDYEPHRARCEVAKKQYEEKQKTSSCASTE